jgi:hypothetical protein
MAHAAHTTSQPARPRAVRRMRFMRDDKLLRCETSLAIQGNVDVVEYAAYFDNDKCGELRQLKALYSRYVPSF